MNNEKQATDAVDNEKYRIDVFADMEETKERFQSSVHLEAMEQMLPFFHGKQPGEYYEGMAAMAQFFFVLYERGMALTTQLMNQAKNCAIHLALENGISDAVVRRPKGDDVIRIAIDVSNKSRPVLQHPQPKDPQKEMNRRQNAKLMQTVGVRLAAIMQEMMDTMKPTDDPKDVLKALKAKAESVLDAYQEAEKLQLQYENGTFVPDEIGKQYSDMDELLDKMDLKPEGYGKGL